MEPDDAAPPKRRPTLSLPKRERPATAAPPVSPRPPEGQRWAPRPPRQELPAAPPRPKPPRPPEGSRPPRPADTRPLRTAGPFSIAPRKPHPAGPKPPPEPPAPHPDGNRISKLMTERGLASRREADEWIAAGYVRVNGEVVVLGQRAQADARIDIDPRAREMQSRLVTVLLHKPIGWVSGQAEDGYEPAVVLVKPENRWEEDGSGIEFHPGQLRHLVPAGRLDIDSTGILVLTQDGRIAKHLIGEDTEVEKEYLVRVRIAGDPRPSDPNALPSENPEERPMHRARPGTIERLRHGLVLDGVPLKPARVSWQNEDQLRVVLREGRKRQIRRMCELVGLDVVGLKRVRIGSVVLGALPLGQWRYLGAHEGF